MHINICDKIHRGKLMQVNATNQLLRIKNKPGMQKPLLF